MAARSLALGDKLLTLGGYDEAIRHYRMVLAFNPAPSIRAKLLENMAYAYHTLGKHLEGASNAKDALDIDTDNVSAWSTLGLSLQKLGEDGQAEKCFREAVKIDPNDGSLWLNLAKFLQYKGNYKKAISAARKAMECPGGDYSPETRDAAQLAASKALREVEQLAQANPTLRDRISRIFGKSG
jgi:tetratricopeptide (TPR) repeat protein